MRLGRRSWWRWTLAALIAVTVSGCKSPSEGISLGDRSTTTTTIATVSTSTTELAVEDDPADEVAQRYVQFWDARFKANEAPVNPDDPALRDVATGSQLENLIRETEKRRADGLAFRKPENSQARRDVEVLSLEGDRAEVRDCAVNDGVLYRVSTGEVVDGSVVTNSIQATLVRVDGWWKVESTRLVQKWDGVAGCALSE